METEEQLLVVMDELREQSLLRLPIKDLIRFGCASKHWYSKIFNSEFCHKYLQFQANNNNNNKLNIMLPGETHGSFQSISYIYDYTNCRFSTPTQLNNQVLNNQNQLLLADFIEKHQFKVVGSCDGLLLVAVTIPNVHGASAIYIWNPTTGVYKILPKLVTTPGSIPFKIFGFGRVPTTDNNYKVVFLEQISSIQGDSRSQKVYKVHLYTTHTNAWQTLPYTLPCHTNTNPYNASLVMELAYDHLHFITEVPIIDDHDLDFPIAIISFDLKTDKYRVLPHPNFDDEFPDLDSICVVNGGLVALTSLGDKCIYLCMMENFGKEDEHWTKKYCLNNHVVIDNPSLSLRYGVVLDIRQDGEILLTTLWAIGANPCIVSYNTNTNRAKILYQHVSSSWTMSMPVVYVESFISPKSTDVQVDEGQQGKFKQRRTSCFQRCTQQGCISTSY